MAGQKQDDQHEHTFSSYVRIRDVALKTCQRWWTIRKSGERESGISVLLARHDDDDDDDDDKYIDTMKLLLMNIKRQDELHEKWIWPKTVFDMKCKCFLQLISSVTDEVGSIFTWSSLTSNDPGGWDRNRYFETLGQINIHEINR